MANVTVTIDLSVLNATELAALQQIVTRACGAESRPAAIAAIDAGVGNAGDEYTKETARVSQFFSER